MQGLRSIPDPVVNKPLALSLDSLDDSFKIPHLDGVFSGAMHVDESSAQVIQSAGTILLAQPLDGALKTKRTKIEEPVCWTTLHAGTIAPGHLRGNLRQKA